MSVSEASTLSESEEARRRDSYSSFSPFLILKKEDNYWECQFLRSWFHTLLVLW